MKTPPNPSRHQDRIFGAAMVFLAIVYGLIADSFVPPIGGDAAFGPKTFPIIIGFVLGFSGLWLIIEPRESTPLTRAEELRAVLFTTIMSLFFAALLEKLGFILSAFGYSGFLAWRMGAKPPAAFLVALFSSIVLYLVFDRLLDLTLPDGVLTALP